MASVTPTIIVVIADDLTCIFARKIYSSLHNRNEVERFISAAMFVLFRIKTELKPFCDEHIHVW